MVNSDLKVECPHCRELIVVPWADYRRIIRLELANEIIADIDTLATDDTNNTKRRLN